MENQHRKIDTYRELGQEELDLINKIKQCEALFLEALQNLNGMRLAQQDFLAEGNSSVDGLNAKQIIKSKEDIKQAIVNVRQASMWSTTAVAIPKDPEVKAHD